MKTHLRRLFIALPLFLILVGGILASTGSIAFAHGLTTTLPSDTSAKAVTSGLLNQDPAKVLAYWTPERMKSARSMDELVVHGKFTPASVQHGTPGLIPPSAPGGLQTLTTSNANAFQVPHSSYSSFPYSTVGKVFFTDSRTGGTGYCSGAAVNSANKSVVDTAGHCVIQGGSGNNWYTNWMFCPQYYNGSTPDGCWVARQFASANTWINSASLEDDFGEAVVYPNSHGYLVNVVGGAGGVYNASASQSFAAVGYPAAFPFNGLLMYQCGPSSPSVIGTIDDGKAIAIPCSMTPGSSGGPWFIPFNGSLYVNGHVDFSLGNYPGQLFTPYYDNDWLAVFNLAQNA